MTTHDVGKADQSMLAQKCTEHAVAFQDCIGFTSTNDPMIGEKDAYFTFSKFDQRENCFELIEKNW